ncbi:MAG: polyribonucleotide nucleotidyltransferase [Oligoflexales bacterium]
MSIVKEVEIGGKTIKFEFQKYAKLTNGSVMVSCGDTQVLVTVCASEKPKEGQDFFPLTVDYIEKFYAAGRIPGGFIKRETKPSDREALTARVIDRPLRPCFPEEYLCETHIVCTVVSLDPQHHPAPLALLGASTALMISDIPFNGPVASVRLGLRDGEFVQDPSESEGLDLDLNLGANPDAILMVEAGANFLSEEKMLEAITHGHKLMAPLFKFQKDMAREIGKPKRELSTESLANELYEQIPSSIKGRVRDAFSSTSKKDRSAAIGSIAEELAKELNPDQDSKRASALKGAFERLLYVTMRAMILDDKRRIDGRSFTDIRKITCEVGVLKRTHGSALFTRGETQSLSTTTLGSSDDEQKLDSIMNVGPSSKRFMLHYNFPPYSVGEARPMRAPGRREIGHGNLAEKALLPVLPPANKFGYSIRLVSEILESNGSSSMATVCAGTMALYNAGVPLLQPVAGIAMGLVKEGDKYAVLSDILGDEDHLGDMDFKVAGGREGITALQMDIKIGGVSREILGKALDQAKQGRLHILDKIVAVIDAPSDLSEFAPRIFTMKIKEDKIRDVIGPGGKTIRGIIADTGVKIDISDDGTVNIVSPTSSAAENVKNIIRSITSEPEVGAIQLGKVKRIVDFGAFVELRPGLEGLLHISQLDNKRIDKVTDVLSEGEEVLVKIIEVDKQGRVKLSRKEALGKKPTP